MRNNVYSDTFWYGDMFLPVWAKNENFSKFHIQYIYEKLWGDDIINSLIWIFIRTGQEVFSEKNVKFQNVISSLFLIQFSSFFHCSVGKNVLFLLKLIQFWSGFPL